MIRSGLGGAKRHALPFSSLLLFYQMQAEMSRATSAWVFIFSFMGLTYSGISSANWLSYMMANLPEPYPSCESVLSFLQLKRGQVKHL